MKVNKEIVVLVLLIGALAAYIVLRDTDRRRYELPELAVLEPAAVTRVVVHRGEEEDGVTLERDGRQWLIRPAGYPADVSLVDGMLGILSGLTITAVASEAGNDAIYDLGPDRRIRVEAFEGDRPARLFLIGKAAPTGRHTFVKLEEDDKRIYHALENFRSRFDKDAGGLRDMQVMKIEDEIAELVFTEGDRRLRVVKGPRPERQEPDANAISPDEGLMVWDPEDTDWRTEEGRAVKSDKIDGLVRTLSSLRCAGYPPESIRETLGEPAFSVSLTGAGEYSFSMYGKQDGKVLCTSSQSDYVFLLPEWQADRIRLDLEDILEFPEEEAA